MMKGAVLSVVDPDVTVTSQQLECLLDGCDPLACVLYSHSPSVQMYYALRSRLESSSKLWLQEFVSLDGLDSLLDSLGQMTGPSHTGFSDAILQIDCLSCIRAILNTQMGMEALINSGDGIRKLLRGADIANTLPRKHVMELLSAVCVYSKLANSHLLVALESHKRQNHLYHRFSFIVNDLKMAETIPHKTSLLTLVNALISSAEDITQRNHIRQEFIGLGLLDILAFLQREDSDEDLYIQLEHFQEKKHEDDTCLESCPSCDLSSPQDLVDSIQTKVFGGPRMVCFVNILQDLLAIETLDKEKSSKIWQVLERHVRHVVHGTNVDTLSEVDTETACQALVSATLNNAVVPSSELGLLKPKHKAKPSRDKCLGKKHSTSSLKRDGISLKTSADSGYLGCEEKQSPPHKDNNSLGDDQKFNFLSGKDELKLPTEKQDFNFNDFSKETFCNVISGTSEKEEGKKGRQVSQYDNMSPLKPSVTTNVRLYEPTYGHDMNDLNLQTMGLLTKMKTTLDNISLCSADRDEVPRRSSFHLNFNSATHSSKTGPSYCFTKNKILDLETQHLHKNSSYRMNQVASPAQRMRNLKWIKLNEATVEQYAHSLWMAWDISKVKIQPDFPHVEEMFREKFSEDQIADTPLLSNHCRLKLNLFLNRLDEEPTELVRRLVRVDEPCLSLPFIKHLMDILPDYDEIKQLKCCNGNLQNLGQAEQFVLHLSDLPDYMTLLTGQLRRAEFFSTVPHLTSVLSSMLEISHVILSNVGLKEIMFLVLNLGNFLNHGQFNGHAVGFKLSSLTRLAAVKSQEPGHNLMHFLVEQVESTDDRLLSFISEIPRLERSVSLSPADIKTEFDRMNTQINSFVSLLASANPIIRAGFDKFLEEVKGEFRKLQSQITDLKFQSQRLAEFFCESDSFELQSCLKILLDFFKQLRKCRQELRLMKRQKIAATSHCNMFSRQLKTKHLVQKFGQEAGASSSMVEERKPVVELILMELLRGNFTPLQALEPPPSSQPPLLAPHSSPESPVKGTHSPKTRARDATTPDNEVCPMELSRISLMGTPMMNRPSSEVLDEEFTISTAKAEHRLVTSSVKNLPDSAYGAHPRIAPILAISKPTTTHRKKTHHRSQSDLADSIHGTAKWIRYHDNRKRMQVHAPLARPESSLTLATLNLEANSLRNRRTIQQSAALEAGPTIELPPDEDIELPGEFIRQGKKGERKSTLSNFLNRISKRVLKPKNIEQNAMKGEGGSELKGGREDTKDQRKVEKTKGGSLGKASGTTLVSKNPNLKTEYDKENVCTGAAELEGNPFARNLKNPIRLSNRFKNKIMKI